MKDYKDDDFEEEGREEEIFKFPRYTASFAREVSLGTDTTDTGAIEYFMDCIMELVDARIKYLSEQDEVFEDDLRVQFKLVEVPDNIKREVLDRLEALGYEVYNAVESEEDLEYSNEMNKLAEEGDELIQQMIQEWIYKSDSFFIYW